MRAGGDPTVKSNGCTWAEGCRPCSIGVMIDSRIISPNEPFARDDAEKLNAGLPTSQFTPSDVPGQLCFRNDGSVSSRALADMLDDRCESILGNDAAAEKKCDAIEKTVEDNAKQTDLQKSWDTLKYGALTFAIFGPALTVWGAVVKKAFPKIGGAAMLPFAINPFQIMCAGSDGKDPMCVGRTGGPEA